MDPNTHRPLSTQESIFNHVALPAQLPHRADANVPEIERVLVDYLLKAAQFMRDAQNGHLSQAWDSVRRCLDVCKTLNLGGQVERPRLVTTLRQMQAGDFLVLHIEAQNAGIFIRRPLQNNEDQWVIFEFFEASPKREDVIQSETGALKWAFPGSAIAIPKATWDGNEFISTLSTFLAQSSSESIKQVAVYATKAGSSVWEDRDTVEPSLITILLAAILEANGQRLQATLLTKKVSDDVCWKDAARPWRRLPYWLVQRVAIARYLALACGEESFEGWMQYKLFQCIVHCLVLEGTQTTVSLENVAHLKSKVCRRLFKLDRESSSWPAPTQIQYRDLLNNLESVIGLSISKIDRRVLDTWQREVATSVKQIPQLPKMAESQHCRLELRLSREVIQNAQRRYQQSLKSSTRLASTSPIKAEVSRMTELSAMHSRLFQQADSLRALCAAAKNEPGSVTCAQLKRKLIRYIDAVGTNFENNVELMSSFLLDVFEVWVTLDRTACQDIPLLRQFHPGFAPKLLDVLSLPGFSDMLRARKIQSYLQERIDHVKSSITIFTDHQSGCFAERYFDECDDDGTMNALLFRIKTEAEAAKKAKEAQWRELTAQFDNLTRQYEASTCLYIDDGVSGPKHEAWRCPRCTLNTRRTNMRIRAFEEPLPDDDKKAKLVVFELMPPPDFVAYRDATWAIWHRLCIEKQEAANKPRVCLQDYSELKKYVLGKPGEVGEVTLGSTAKSFLMTHYATSSFPINLDQVIQPNALKYGYYSETTKSWPGRLNSRPSLAHHCKIPIHPSSPYSSWLEKRQFAVDSDGPSSYEIIANHTSCPASLNAQEFFTFQSLLSGKATRWITILAELASPNLNMAATDSVLLLKHLSSQLGPVDSENREGAGIIHTVFRDPVFCQTLLRLLRQKADDIKDNWREMLLMEVVINLTLRMTTLAVNHAGSSEWVPDALLLLETTRQTSLKWMRDLRNIGHEITEVEAAKQNQYYTLWASVLCKQTFATYLTSMGSDMDFEDLAILIECSASAHDSTPETIKHLPLVLQQSLASDTKLQYRLKAQVKQALIYFGNESLLHALQHLGLEVDLVGGVDVTSDDDGWVTASLRAEGHRREQTLQYNYVHGTLLVDGEPLTRLVPDPENEAILTELFGVQNLRRYPSGLPGMTHQLALSRGGYNTHIGYTDQGMIIQAKKGNQLLELIPRHCFIQGHFFDLPAELVDECYHWLDLRTGIIEIRPLKSAWWSHPSHWRIDTCNSTGYRLKTQSSRIMRNDQTLKDTLVDPNSPLAIRISKLFEYFEYKRYITIFQPARYSLTIDLRRMNLRWFVNDKHALQSRQLSVQIDFNQDIGTWYGFRSALVCQSVSDTDDRSVLVPLLRLTAVRHGSHVLVNGMISHDRTINYIRYRVNPVLGRLDCASEPVLVYKKAEIHALTSSMLADPLTRRTGSEEALAILDSALAQPWTTLRPLAVNILHDIARLCPRRQYYPEGMRLMQTALWNPDLPCHTQREEYPLLVHQIMQQAARLNTFVLDVNFNPPKTTFGNLELNLRALNRRDKHRRRLEVSVVSKNTNDRQYNPRDRPRNHGKYAMVLETTVLLKLRPESMPTCPDLAQKLSEALVLRSFNEAYDKPTISDRLDTNIRRDWGPLIKATRKMEGFELMFFIGTIAFGNHVERDLLRTLVAFSVLEPLRTITLPSSPVFDNFRPHQAPQATVLVKLVEQYKAPAPAEPELAEFANNKQKKILKLAREAHEKQAVIDCDRFVRHLVDQWPCELPMVSLPEQTFLLDIPTAYSTILQQWTQLYMNRELSLHLDAVQKVLNDRATDRATERPDFHATDAEFLRPEVGDQLPLLFDILTAQGEMFLMDFYLPEMRPAIVGTKGMSMGPFDGMPLRQPTSKVSSAVRVDAELFRIVKSLSNSTSLVRQRYAADLQRSFQALSDIPLEAIATGPKELLESPQTLHSQVMALLDKLISRNLNPSHRFNAWQIRWLQSGQLWPAATMVTLLEQLQSSRALKVRGAARGQILELGLRITDYQRAVRIQKYTTSNESNRRQEELDNSGHSKWKPEDYPDWLLLEIECDILIRDTQFEVAQAIISPESRKCSVLQLNMGQGKTSCIIPMAAAVLADEHNLVRVCVPKALLQQTAQLLQTRLGGLVGRRISHVPFSRKTPTDEFTIKQYHRLHTAVQKDRGIMLCLPEHQLSFSLSTSQRILDDRVPEARMMIRVQDWLQEHARDVLDESDHTLAVRTQLIYPSGSQTAVDGHPHRWLVAEQLLALVELQLDNLRRSFPQSIEVVRRDAGGFPYVFLLRGDVEEELIKRLTWDICRGHRGILPMESLDTVDRLAIKEFLTSYTVRPDTVDRISRICPDQAHIRSTVYVLRGLLVHRILVTALKKRYGVTYGLHEHRDPVAVPFHAKGVPSDTSEFGHVDVSILLTCLAFYHKGLNTSQVKEALNLVLRSDDPAAEYDNWCDHESFPDHLKNWHSINAGDEQQIADIHSCVKYKIVVIDYYLNNFVFPRHAKQFRVKLQKSGWDIPLFKAGGKDDGASGRHLTTGFSGTNDIKPLLPLTISQDDIPSLLKTNAEVLTYLLQPRSRGYQVMRRRDGKRMNENEFLAMLKSFGRNGIRILIDAGAQVLEMTNEELVKTWLKIYGHASAAVFFREDQPYVMSKTGVSMPLAASAYADNLGDVLIYLDEAHTRGTDLRFGRDARAALTLGLGQTKDHTVQAAMRLRQLGTTQSVTFFAPVEVDQSIRDLCQKKSFEDIDSADVIKWLVHNTCDLTESLQPLYNAQGIDFCKRMQAAADHPHFLSDASERKKYVSFIRQSEKQTLQQLYAPPSKTKSKVKDQIACTGMLAGFQRELAQRRKRFQDTGHAVHASVLEEVEQEREIEQEVEAVRQVKKPLPCTPLKFPGLHRDLETFARTGRFAAGSDIFVPSFTFISRTSTGKKYKVNQKAGSAKLFVTAEFTRTVRVEVVATNDNFIRPVQWILLSLDPEVAVIITPEEAECLIPILRSQKMSDSATYAPLYLLTYSGPVTRRMRNTLGSFKFYSIPTLPESWTVPLWLKVEAGVLAGRLYFDWDEYAELCKFLGIDVTSNAIEEELADLGEIEKSEQEPSSESDNHVTDVTDLTNMMSFDGAADTVPRPKPSAAIVLSSKPFSFTRDWLSIRRRGQDFSHSPMGFLCLRKPLHEDHVFFNGGELVRHKTKTQTNSSMMTMGLAHTTGLDDEEASAAIPDEIDFGDHDPAAALKSGEAAEKFVFAEDELNPQSPSDSEYDSDGTPEGGHATWSGHIRETSSGSAVIERQNGARGNRGRGGRRGH